MNVDQVMIEEVVTETNGNVDSIKHASINEEENVDNSLSTNKEDLQCKETGDIEPTKEVIIIDEVKTLKSHDEKMNEDNEAPKLQEASGDNENINVTVITIDDNKECVNDITLEPTLTASENNENSEAKSKTILPENDKVSSLSSIAMAYGDSDLEDEDSEQIDQNVLNETPRDICMQSYRETVVDLISEESDSEDDSNSSSSDSSSSDSSSHSDSNDSSKKNCQGSERRTRRSHEIKSELDDLPPIEDLKISVPEVLCEPLGEVSWMVNQLVVVKPKPGKPTLNFDTVLFILKGQRALGKVFDVFGQVNEPHYCVRFNSSEHIKESDVNIGMTVYFCPNTEYTSLVFLNELMKMKGVDATADEPPEFSDDEEERAYYEKLKGRQANIVNDTEIPFKRKRCAKPTSGWQSNHPWNRNVQMQARDYHTWTNRQSAVESQAQHSWSYENHYRYAEYPPQRMQYSYQEFNGGYQNLYPPQSYYNSGNTTVPLYPRIPFNTSARASPDYRPYLHPTMQLNARYPSMNGHWNAQPPQVPMRMRIPWMSMPPPPPPPLPSSLPSTDTS